LADTHLHSFVNCCSGNFCSKKGKRRTTKDEPRDGIMNPKKYLENRIRGWLPKEHPVVLGQKTLKPIWWRPLWIATWILTVVLGIIGFVALSTPILHQMIIGLFLGLICFSAAICIRVKPSFTNRALYILLGITSLGFLLSVAYEFLLGRYVTGWPLGWFNIIAII